MEHHPMEWQPLDSKLVVEVEFDPFAGSRFGQGTRFLRWRPDKDPADCTMDQVTREPLGTDVALRFAHFHDFLYSH